LPRRDPHAGADGGRAKMDGDKDAGAHRNLPPILKEGKIQSSSPAYGVNPRHACNTDFSTACMGTAVLVTNWLSSSSTSAFKVRNSG
jgi:hypothetical protein